jgi:hypothetical protein
MKHNNERITMMIFKTLNSMNHYNIEIFYKYKYKKITQNNNNKKYLK